MKNDGIHGPCASQASQTNPCNSLVSQYPPDHGKHVLKGSATSTGEQDIPVQWSKFIHTSPKPRMTKTPFQIAVHVGYSPIASMNYKWTINLHDGYPLFQVMKPEGYIPPSLHILKHDLSSLAPPKGEMKSSFSWTRAPHPALYVLVNLHLESSTKSSRCVASHEALYGTLHLQSSIKHIPLCDSSVHTGTPFSVPSSSSETIRFSNRHSNLVTTPSSRMIHGKPKIKVTKVLTHQVDKNEEYFHGENWPNTTKNGKISY